MVKIKIIVIKFKCCGVDDEYNWEENLRNTWRGDVGFPYSSARPAIHDLALNESVVSRSPTGFPSQGYLHRSPSPCF